VDPGTSCRSRFEPEGPHQIRTYLDTAVDSDLNQEKVKQILEDWLYEQ